MSRNPGDEPMASAVISNDVYERLPSLWADQLDLHLTVEMQDAGAEISGTERLMRWMEVQLASSTSGYTPEAKTAMRAVSKELGRAASKLLALEDGTK